MKVDIVLPQNVKCNIALKLNTIFTAIENRTPLEIEDWVDANVNDLSDVRRLLTLLLIYMKAG